MNELQVLPGFFSRRLMADPTLALARATCWLDPIHFYPEDALEDAYWGAMEDDAEAATLVALRICRDLFPATFAEALQHIRKGTPFNDLDAFICQGIQRQFRCLQLSTIYDLRYGVPVEWAGINLGNPDQVDEHAWVIDLLADFGVEPHDSYGGKSFDYDEVSQAWEVGQRIVRDLALRDGQPWADLALLLLWLFSSTGNSLADYSYEEWAENGYETLEWDLDTLALVEEVADEATIILEGALRGLDYLHEDQTLRDAFRANVRILKQALEKGDVDAAIYWPERETGNGRAEDSHQRTAQPDAQVLFIRMHCDQTD